MKITILSIILLAISTSCGNTTGLDTDPTPIQPSRVTMENAMPRAIEDFITLVKKEQGILLDSLYFGKHQYGQEDDFPEVALPDKIGGCVIKLVSMERAEAHQRLFPNTYYVNLISTLDTNRSEFIFITFYAGFKHQFDYTLTYAIDQKGLQFVKHQFKDYR